MRPTVKLWEIANIKSWKRLPKWNFVQDKKTEYPYIRVSDFWDNWTVDISTVKYITKEIYEQISKYIITDKDLYVSIAWTIWKTWIIPAELNWANLTENAVRLVYNWKYEIDNRYILYFTNSKSFGNQAWLASRAVAMPKLAISRLQNIEIPLPPLETQKAIVAKLDQIFAELDQTKSEIQKNLDNTDELWKSALNQAFHGNWGMKTLQDVCLQKITDWTHQTPTYCGEKEWIPFISSKDVTKEYIDREWWIKHIPQSLHEELYARIAPQKDDVLLAKNWTTWVAAIVEDDRIFDIYVTLAVLRPNQKIITPRFLHRIVNSPICKRQFDKSLKWAGVPNLHLENIKTVTIPVPPLSEQEKIVEHLDQVSQEVKELKLKYQSQLDNLEELKKSVLDKAFKWELVE